MEHNMIIIRLMVSVIIICDTPPTCDSAHLKGARRRTNRMCNIDPELIACVVRCRVYYMYHV